MTIQSINAYTPQRGASSSLNRTWATKEQIDNLQKQLDDLRKAVEDNIEVRNNLTSEMSISLGNTTEIVT